MAHPQLRRCHLGEHERESDLREFGKTISWSRYILERLDGFEDRPVPAAPERTPSRLLGPRTDIEKLPEFYAACNST